jgi:alpha-D-xyloside xylohydrolase
MKLLSFKIFIILFLLECLSSNAQNYKKTEFGIQTSISDIEIELQFFNESTLRVIKHPKGKDFIKQSLSVILKPLPIKLVMKEEGNILSVRSSKLQVFLDLKDGKISFFDLDKHFILTEKQAGTDFTDFDDAGSKTYTVSQCFLLEKEEEIYGLGQQQEGKMSKRNTKLNMIQGNTDDYIPFMLSSKGYGLFWDNYSPTIFEDNTSTTYFKSEVGDGVDYYFMYGGNGDTVVSSMRMLTGKAPMFPLWTFGFWQSRERYKSQDELVDVVKKFRELQVPLDGIIQDWQYWGNNYLWNAMEFLNPAFYDPKKMVDDVHSLNAHMIISIWNSFGPNTKPYKSLDKIGALYNFKTWPESGVEKFPVNKEYPSGVRAYDPFNPFARDIYWDYLNKGIFSLGMDGWWMDSSEPDHLDSKTADFDTKTYLGSFRKVRNAFPLMTVGGVAEHQLKESNDKRIFILTRSAFAGQQRYGANTWSGDVNASWGALRNQISAGLNFSLSGIPYWNSDIGGFFLWDFKNPLTNIDYRELHVRWMEFGTFCPMMRSHGEGVPRELYHFGKKGNPTYDAIEKYIHLRYSLLPYIYATSWDVTSKNSSMMRALVMDFANDRNALNINDEFMFGKSILVAPVTEAMYWKNQTKEATTTSIEDYGVVKTKEVYLPNGTSWFDFWTGESIQGGQTIKKEVPLDIIPLYLKAGTILPFGPKVQFATEKKWDDLEVRVYEGADGEFTLYEDENDNYNYEKGMYSNIKFSWNNKNKILTISNRKGTFSGMLNDRKFNIVFVSKNKGVGAELTNKYDKVVYYVGEKIIIVKEEYKLTK